MPFVPDKIDVPPVQYSQNSDSKPPASSNSAVMQAPPVGFIFVIRSDVEEDIPVLYFGLQKSNSKQAVSVRAQAGLINLTGEVLCEVRELLVHLWKESYGDLTPPVKNNFLKGMNTLG